jgi:hypothetical protein
MVEMMKAVGCAKRGPLVVLNRARMVEMVKHPGPAVVSGGAIEPVDISSPLERLSESPPEKPGTAVGPAVKGPGVSTPARL